nr:hypothetical protein GCM10017611_66020 [Rhodococcus wratislaviensis]
MYHLWWRRQVHNVRLARWIEQGGRWVIFGTLSGTIEVRARDRGVISRWPLDAADDRRRRAVELLDEYEWIRVGPVLIVDQQEFFVPVTHRPHQRPRGPEIPWTRSQSKASAIGVHPTGGEIPPVWCRGDSLGCIVIVFR